MQTDYCRAITKKELLCKKKACKNSAFCVHHKIKNAYNKFKYNIPLHPADCDTHTYTHTHTYTDYIDRLPEELLHKIYKTYFTAHVLKELSYYDPQGDFSNIDKDLYSYLVRFSIPNIERDYRLVCDHDLWDIFRRSKTSHDYLDVLVGAHTSECHRKFQRYFKPLYTNGYGFIVIHRASFITNMRILEYIANNGWFKFIMAGLNNVP